jgi:hypothetical protein
MPVTPYTVMGDGDWLESGKLGRLWKGMGLWRGEGIATGHKKYRARLEMGLAPR